MMKFRSVFDRYEASELSQLEAAELLGMSAHKLKPREPPEAYASSMLCFSIFWLSTASEPKPG